LILWQEKFEELHRKKIEQGKDLNQIIMNKKAFRNPSIYEKLILHCSIDELGLIFSKSALLQLVLC